MPDSDKNLSAELRRRKPAAWSRAYDCHAAVMLGFVYHLVGRDRSVAEEICQETWLAGIDHIDQFDDRRGTLRNWLFGIARQCVALHYRRQASDGARRAYRQDVFVAAPDGSPLPEEALERIERVDAVRAAMLLLDEDHRSALIAKYVDGLSVDQIASRNGKTSKAVESLLARARSQMRTLLRWYFRSPNEP